jgi:hypothetical protein
VHPGNLLLGVYDNDLLKPFEEREMGWIEAQYQYVQLLHGYEGNPMLQEAQ